MTTNVFLVGQRHQLRPGTEPLWQAYSGFYVALKHPMGREFSRCIDGMVEGGITQVEGYGKTSLLPRSRRIMYPLACRLWSTSSVGPWPSLSAISPVGRGRTPPPRSGCATWRQSWWWPRGWPPWPPWPSPRRQWRQRSYSGRSGTSWRWLHEGKGRQLLNCELARFHT